MVDENKGVEFIKKIREKKVEGLMGLALDLHYYDKKITSFGNEDNLRDKLSDEQDKATKDGDGRIILDKRDMNVVADINAKIGKLQKLNSNKLEAEEVKKDIEFYLELLDKLEKDLLEKGEMEVSKVINELAKL